MRKGKMILLFLMMLSIVITISILFVSYIGSKSINQVRTKWSGNELVVMTLSGVIRIDGFVCTYQGTTLVAILPEPYYVVDSSAITISKETWQKLVWLDDGNLIHSSPPLGSDVRALYYRYKNN
jgi:hypothetical protein